MRWIHGYVYKNGFVLDSFSLNALVDIYGKCGSLGKARKVSKHYKFQLSGLLKMKL